MHPLIIGFILALLSPAVNARDYFHPEIIQAVEILDSLSTKQQPLQPTANAEIMGAAQNIVDLLDRLVAAGLHKNETTRTDFIEDFNRAIRHLILHSSRGDYGSESTSGIVAFKVISALENNRFKISQQPELLDPTSLSIIAYSLRSHPQLLYRKALIRGIGQLDSSVANSHLLQILLDEDGFIRERHEQFQELQTHFVAALAPRLPIESFGLIRSNLKYSEVADGKYLRSYSIRKAITMYHLAKLTELAHNYLQSDDDYEFNLGFQLLSQIKELREEIFEELQRNFNALYLSNNNLSLNRFFVALTVASILYDDEELTSNLVEFSDHASDTKSDPEAIRLRIQVILDKRIQLSQQAARITQTTKVKQGLADKQKDLLSINKLTSNNQIEIAEKVENLIVYILTSEKPGEVRALAAKSLGQLGFANRTEILKLVNSEDLEIRWLGYLAIQELVNLAYEQARQTTGFRFIGALQLSGANKELVPSLTRQMEEQIKNPKPNKVQKAILEKGFHILSQLGETSILEKLQSSISQLSPSKTRTSLLRQIDSFTIISAQMCEVFLRATGPTAN